jgi:predicted nuclease with TOPRIM domain
MSITAFWQTVRRRWRDLAENLWPDSPEERARAETDRLTANLSVRFRRLVRLRQGIERLRAQIEGQQRELNELPVIASSETQEASLARVQLSIERMRRRLNRLEGTYQKQRDRLEWKKRLLQGLRSGRVRVVR